METACTTFLLDIEGTVSPVAFVYDVMFPYARQHVAGYLESGWEDPDTRDAVQWLARDEGHENAEAWFAGQAADTDPLRQEMVVRSVHRLMDEDAKLTGLKKLQGLVWRRGFEDGRLVSTLFPDVLENLRHWKQAGRSLCIYSSGSVAAQRLFFGHTRTGDLGDLFSGFFDTTWGPKKQAASYRAIADELGEPPATICFVSDITDELDAAREAGMQTVLRAAGPTETDHPVITGFDEIRLVR